MEAKLSSFVSLLLTLFATVHSNSARAVEWVQWASATPGNPGNAIGAISTAGVGVAYAGEILNLVPNYPSWSPATTFSGGTVANPPPPSGGIVQLIGGNAGVNTITFSKPVVDPVLAIWSLGGHGNSASFGFQTAQQITIESGGPSSEYGGGSITQTGNSIYGIEGNGTIKLHGIFTQISWTNPTGEGWYGFTVGIMGVQTPAIPFPPQKIFLAFNQPSSFTLLIIPNPFGQPKPFDIPGSILPAAISDTNRTNVTSKIRDIFSRSGVQNIEWTSSDSDDAVIVYFCQIVNDELLGKSRHQPDRFNSKRRGEVIVFVDDNFLHPDLYAETAAHEIGHALGLRHVDPSSAVDPGDQEVMDYLPSMTPKFINAKSDVTDPLSFSTHNPLYHLLRYIDGWTTIQLESAGISPGKWDTGSTVSTHFAFQNQNLRLYNIALFTSGGDIESAFLLEQITSATLAELSERTFIMPEGLGITLLASSTTNGPLDVISSTGDPFVVTNQIISASGTNSFSLFRQDSPTNAVAVSTAIAEFDTQTPYCKISMSAPSVLRLDFRGTLQSSTNLTGWTDFATNSTSPQFILIGTNDTVGFFRTRQ